MKFLYRTYQLCIVLPIGLIATLITAIVVIIGCALGGQRFFGYYPGRLWSWLLIRLFLLPVKVEGRENMQPGQSYVFCPNHQGAFDIFLVYGFLHRNFKWVMKESLRKIPFVGKACQSAGFVFINNTSRSNITHSISEACHILKDGMSIVIFPEGRRTFTGEMGPYKKGAFLIADELQLPVVPITINGSFNVLPRMKGFSFVTWSPLRLTIHKPIQPDGKGDEAMQKIMQQAYEVTKSKLNVK